MTKLDVGIFGITGAVGQEMLNVLSRSELPVNTLSVYASERSAGKKQETPWGELTIQNAENADFKNLDLALCSIGASWSKENINTILGDGCIMIDNSSAFRYDEGVPLVIPEINPEAIGKSMLIANPNCTTAIAAIPLWEIYKNFGIERAIISTYQAASGAGAKGINELEGQVREYAMDEPLTVKAFAHQLLFNVIPHIDKFQANGYTKEEMKVCWETNKIFSQPTLETIPISCTAVRVPTKRAHAESIAVQTKNPITPKGLVELLKDCPGVTLVDDPEHNVYPMPITASGKYNVEVGRIRQSIAFGDNGIEFYVCGDQILKGAALNAVQIAEEVYKQRLL